MKYCIYFEQKKTGKPEQEEKKLLTEQQYELLYID